jgi:hypothetical protein
MSTENSDGYSYEYREQYSDAVMSTENSTVMQS